MNSFERVMNRFDGKSVDRLPNFSLVMMLAAREVGVPFSEYVTDYRNVVAGWLRCHERYGLDMLCAISDPMREAAGFGAKVVIEGNAVPHCPVRRVQTFADIDTLRVSDPASCERMNDRLEAVRLMRERAGRDLPVCGWVEGALAEACDLMDMQELFMALIEEPEPIEQLLDVALEQAILFAKAQVAAGADMIGVGDAAASLIGPALYEEFAFPREKALVDAIHAAGAKVKLHICGNISPLLEMVWQTGADMVDFDFMVDLERGAELFPETTCICGNFDPVEIMLHGTTDAVRAATRRALAIRHRNRNFIAPGCEVPPDTPRENLLAMQETIEESGAC